MSAARGSKAGAARRRGGTGALPSLAPARIRGAGGRGALARETARVVAGLAKGIAISLRISRAPALTKTHARIRRRRGNGNEKRSPRLFLTQTPPDGERP